MGNQSIPKNALQSQVKKAREARTIPRSFIDIEFPPCDESINKTIVKSLLARSVAPNQELSTTGFDRVIHWRRPVEYLSAEAGNQVMPRLFRDSIPEETHACDLLSEVKDINRGKMSHEWIISAVVCVLEKNE